MLVRNNCTRQIETRQIPHRSLRRTMIETRPKSSSFKLLTENREVSYLPSYKCDYTAKPVVYTESIRAGTASGCRSNNPHPSMAFMIWRLPSIKQSTITHTTSSSIHDNLPPIPVDTILDNERFLSTYDDHFCGIQHKEIQHSLEYFKNVKESIPQANYSLQSTTRRAYQIPHRTSKLRNFTTRYDCNREMVKIAKGALPTIVSPHSIIGASKTQYTSDYGTPCKLPKLSCTDQGKGEKRKSQRVVRFSPQSSWLSEWPGPTSL